MSDPHRVHSVPLPPGAEPPIHVYVNGEEWTPDEDFRVADGRLHFSRPLRARPPLGLGRTVMLAIGIGVYGDLKGDTLDVGYRIDGRLTTASIPLTAGAAAPPPPG